MRIPACLQGFRALGMLGVRIRSEKIGDTFRLFLDTSEAYYCFCQVRPPSEVTQNSEFDVVTFPCCGSGNSIPAMSLVRVMPAEAGKTRTHVAPASSEWQSIPALPPAQTSRPEAATLRNVGTTA